MGEKLKRLELLKDIVQQAIERGATSVQQIHEYVGNLPFEALDRAGLLDDRVQGLREKHQRTVGTVYDAIRRINREIGQLISDQIENLEDGQAAARVIKGARTKAEGAVPARKKAKSARSRAAAKKAPRRR
ncbi:MAG TPA: hypothetical protein VGE57_05395 [Solimonas sp.]